MINSAAQEAALAWLQTFKTNGRPAVNIIGPTASGKTRLALLLCSRVSNPLVTSPLEEEPADLARKVVTAQQSYCVRSVAEFAGLSYGPRVDLLVIEDAEFLDVASVRAIVLLARQRTIPIVLVSATPLRRPSSLICQQIRLFKPTVRQAAHEIVRARGIDERIALAVCSRFGGDIRQAKLELGILYGRSGPTVAKADITCADPLQRTPLEVAKALFSSTKPDFTVQLMQCLERDDASRVRALVADHYVKCTSGDVCFAADAISLADTLSSKSRGVADVLGLSAAGFVHGVKIPFVSDCNVPALIKCSADWKTVDAVERRIVQTLAIGGRAVAQSVVLEMSSLGIPLHIAEWDKIRLAAAVGRPPTVVNAESRAALSTALFESSHPP